MSDEFLKSISEIIARAYHEGKSVSLLRSPSKQLTANELRRLTEKVVDAYVLGLRQSQPETPERDATDKENPPPYETLRCQRTSADQKYTSPNVESLTESIQSINLSYTEKPDIMTSKACSGFEPILVGTPVYCSVQIPQMNICQPCYLKAIKPSGFATHFKRIESTPANLDRYCDFACKAVRDVWADIRARAGSSPTANEQTIWLGEFRTHMTALTTQLTELGTQIETLRCDISYLESQADLSQLSAVIQFQTSHTSAMMGRMGGPGLSLGNQSLVNASQMKMEIVRKKITLDQCVKQVSAITGIEPTES